MDWFPYDRDLHHERVKTEPLHQCFPGNFDTFFKVKVLQNICEHLLPTEGWISRILLKIYDGAL